LPLFSLTLLLRSRFSVIASTTLFRSGFYSYAASITGDSPDTPSGLLSIGVDVVLPPFPPDVAVTAPSSVEVPAGENASFQLSLRSEEHTSNSSHVSISYAVFCLKKKT